MVALAHCAREALAHLRSVGGGLLCNAPLGTAHPPRGPPRPRPHGVRTGRGRPARRPPRDGRRPAAGAARAGRRPPRLAPPPPDRARFFAPARGPGAWGAPPRAATPPRRA